MKAKKKVKREKPADIFFIFRRDFPLPSAFPHSLCFLFSAPHYYTRKNIKFLCLMQTNRYFHTRNKRNLRRKMAKKKLFFLHFRWVGGKKARKKRNRIYFNVTRFVSMVLYFPSRIDFITFQNRSFIFPFWSPFPNHLFFSLYCFIFILLHTYRCWNVDFSIDSRTTPNVFSFLFPLFFCFSLYTDRWRVPNLWRPVSTWNIATEYSKRQIVPFYEWRIFPKMKIVEKSKRGGQRKSKRENRSTYSSSKNVKHYWHSLVHQ